MNRWNLIAVALLTGLATAECRAQARPAQEWFDLAAQQFVKQDKLTALKTLDRALQEHPDNPQLQQLAEALLKEDKQQEKQQQQQQQENKQGEKDKQDQQQKGQDQQGDKKEQADGDQTRQKEQEKKKEQEQASSGEKKQEGGPGGTATGKITPMDAKRVLDALQREEQAVQQKARIKQRPAHRSTTDKDW